MDLNAMLQAKTVESKTTIDPAPEGTK